MENLIDNPNEQDVFGSQGIGFTQGEGLNLMFLKYHLQDEPKEVYIRTISGNGFLQRVSYKGGAPFARKFDFLRKGTEVFIHFKSGRTIKITTVGNDFGWNDEYPELRRCDVSIKDITQDEK